MAYNKAREERKWRIWKEAEEKQLRSLGVSEDDIEKLRVHDWAIFIATYRNEFFYCFFGYRELKLFEREFSKFSTGRKASLITRNLKSYLISYKVFRRLKAEKKKTSIQRLIKHGTFIVLGKSRT